jgi:DNA polymerase type B, organellar and viral
MKTLQRLTPKTRLLTDKFFVFDTETKGLSARPESFVFGVIYGYNFQKVIYNVEDFKKEFLDIRYKGKIIFSHNAEYDLNTIYENIYNIDKEAIFNNKFICASNHNCLFADSLNILDTSVKNIGEMFQLHKFDTPNKFKIGSKNIRITDDDIRYCTRDCEIIYKGLLYFFELAGTIKITCAGLSMDYFRRFFQEYKIIYNETLCEFFYNSYYGGRCEAFELGKLEANVYDINSQYPFVMSYVKFPNPKNLSYKKELDPELFLKNILPIREGCGKFLIKHKKMNVGCLPHRGKKLIFPIGVFEGYWNFNEIRFCIENKLIEIIECKELVYSAPIESPFKKFVFENFKKRNESNYEFENYFYKKMLNSLYGKFSQKVNSNNIYIDNIDNYLDYINELKEKGVLIEIKMFNPDRNDCFIEIKNEKAYYLYHSIPMFSSYITSEARIYLLRNILNNLNAEPVYCDTDSIFFKKIPKNLPIGKKLGEFKLENKKIIDIRGLKNYSYIYNEKIIEKIKGIKKDSKKTGKNSYEYLTMIKTREGLRRNLDTGNFVIKKKTLSGNYDKRIVLKNGQTKPIEL